MSANRDPATFRRELADEVTAELSPALDRISVHLGEEYADADDPEAAAMRRGNGTFEWIAFGFDPHRMWDAHVGVLTADGQVTVGFHVHERLSDSKPATVEPLADEFGADYRYSEAAAEHQFNRPSAPLAAVDPEVLAEDVAAMCRRFKPVVDELES